MILRVTIQKQNSEQLLPKVSTEAFCKIDFLKNFQVGKHLCWTLFPIKLLAKRQATLLKRDSNAGIFLTIAKFFKSSFFDRAPPVAVFVCLMKSLLSIGHLPPFSS